MKWGFVAFPKPPEDYLDFAVEHGFMHMEIDLFNPQQWLSRFHATRIRSLRRQIEERGLTVSFHAPYPLNLADFLPEVRGAAVRYTERLLQVAGELGAEWVTVHPGYGLGIPTLEWVREKAMDGLKRSLDRLIPIAERLQVPLAVENLVPVSPESEIVFLLDNPEELKRLLVDYPSPALKVCIDVGHAEVSEGFHAFWSVAKERCVALHMHDNNCRIDLHLVPGNGNIDWHKILSTLRGDDFSGAVNVELFLDEHKVAAKRYLEKVWEDMNR
ncbi:MAG: sugar phosphate isomerase/epimerase [Armatimonadetes bacterium]|nr:sugar phosphate isomerase/epimerase [Armatimonadota bacterium]MCX7968465.1 sugar phosphate isomerase/epimerase [Armatimonadota bacterium]MDW8143769.1 sugar phosphate isomerase/epimerase family protein [Armatimonadota bacterium]